jgi:sulfonate dioxygenase
MAHLESRKFVSPDSGFPITLHPNFNAKIKDYEPPEPIREDFKPEKDRQWSLDTDSTGFWQLAGLAHQSL